MPTDEQYRRQVGLLMQALPFVAAEECFALKGGTAINFFFRDLPRLSVDIDLAYVPIEDRGTSLREIEAALQRIGTRLGRAVPSSTIRTATLKDDGTVNRLLVRSRGAQIKIEVTPVLRGCVYEPAPRTVSREVERQFGFARTLVVSFSDLYAGKLVAALDRQHPRDLFDVRELLANEGLDDRLRKAFIVYLVSHGRPLADLLAPRRRSIALEFERGLAGLVRVPITVEALAETRETLVHEAIRGMPQSHRRFLATFEAGDPDWSLLDVPHAQTLPAVMWRMENLRRLGDRRRRQLVDQLAQALEG